MALTRFSTDRSGRLVFGAAAVLFGGIALLWRDAETWQTLREIWILPCGVPIGESLMIAQIAAGLGLQHSRTARAGSLVLGLVYFVFSLVCLGRIVTAPSFFWSYGNFFEQFSLLCGAIAAYGLTETDKRTAAMFSRTGRLGLGVCTISFTLGQALYLSATAVLIPKWILPNQMFWAVLTTIAFGLAATAILLNQHAQLAIRLMTLMLGLFGVLVWAPLLVAHPEAHSNWSEFSLNFLITGASWTIGDLR